MKDAKWDEAARYLVLTCTKEDIIDMELEDYVHTRKFHMGSLPGITTSEVDTPLHMEIMDDDSRLLPPVKIPDTEMKAKIISEAVAKGVTISMTSHTYRFNRIIRIQSKGGPMGDALSGVVARVEMLEQDTNILDLLRENEIKNYMYRRYVDDQLGA
jgi:hypothetical protein